MKIVKSKAELAPQMPWVEDFSETQIQGIGAIEVVGAIGTVAPWATGIAPVLTPLAATGLALTMAGAAITHIKRAEYGNVVPPIVLLIIAALIALGRFQEIKEHE